MDKYTFGLHGVWVTDDDEDLTYIAEENYTKELLNDIEMEKQIQETKALRKEIDEIIQRVKTLQGCRETSIVVTKLQEAVMWLGMNLKRIGEAQGKDTNPYPESKEAWEYCEVSYQHTCETSKAVMNKIAEGWQMVSDDIAGRTVKFRRPNTKIEPTADGLKL